MPNIEYLRDTIKRDGRILGTIEYKTYDVCTASNTVFVKIVLTNNVFECYIQDGNFSRPDAGPEEVPYKLLGKTDSFEKAYDAILVYPRSSSNFHSGASTIQLLK